MVAENGQEKLAKGERVPHYYRAREQVNVLMGHRMVGTANNHAGDYGAEGLLEQFEILRRSGLASAGSGMNPFEACSPTFVEHDGLTVGFLSVDTTWPTYRAKEGKPGTAMDASDPPAAVAALAEHATARQGLMALAAVHWGKNKKSRPSKDSRASRRH